MAVERMLWPFEIESPFEVDDWRFDNSSFVPKTWLLLELIHHDSEVNPSPYRIQNLDRVSISSVRVEKSYMVSFYQPTLDASYVMGSLTCAYLWVVLEP